MFQFVQKKKNRETINFSEKMKISSKIEMFILFYFKVSLKSIEIKNKYNKNIFVTSFIEFYEIYQIKFYEFY